MTNLSDPVTINPGMVCVTTHGIAQAETMQAYGDLRARAQAIGLTNVVWAFAHSGLVDKARNDAGRSFLATKPNLEWLTFFDADMIWEPNVLERLCTTAFKDAPWANIVGAYCQLRGAPNLPTIDTGTGTWEPIEANTGLHEVIRTGSACVLIKRAVFETVQFPWYGIRHVPRGIDALLEVDNLARCKLDGRNPFAEHEDWQKLLSAAREDAARQRGVTDGIVGWEYSTVGEDSGLCDRAKALGHRIVVNADIVVGHIEKRVIEPSDLVKNMQQSEREMRLAAGVTA